jgi:hypothetical protein
LDDLPCEITIVHPFPPINIKALMLTRGYQYQGYVIAGVNGKLKQKEEGRVSSPYEGRNMGSNYWWKKKDLNLRIDVIAFLFYRQVSSASRPLFHFVGCG